MTLLQIIVLALIQGAAELLPVSSSAHVIVAEKLMGLDPTSPEMTLLLVMLHTGTMAAVILYFWSSWKENYFAARPAFWNFAQRVAFATFLTGAIGLTLKFLIEKFALKGGPHAEIELIFGNLALIGIALGTVGLLIIYAGVRTERSHRPSRSGLQGSSWIGIVQGLCLPFRGFSRSGATISTGLLLGISKERAEEFSFALAVVLTPPVIVREVLRLLKAQASLLPPGASVFSLFVPSLLGMGLSCLAGLLALRWLSLWLEQGRWQLFGIYCLLASAAVLTLYKLGY
ncbi:MAG: undecaprenyl-diphosphate phosphatase [Deltaproteobacteria bacterium]|nr:undecaprenyl-diphosphate phosphatase [Deltaproteobacteria bacterium]